jgi:hypothetical protein
MPPSARFDFVTRMPANNKWAWNETSALKNLPEYLIDVNHIYRFTYDQGLNDIEDEFAQGAASGGDLSFDGRVYEFFGEAAAKGEGLIPRSPAVPASVPYLSNKITFTVSRDAAMDIIASKAQYYPTAESEVRLISVGGPRLPGRRRRAS